MDARSPTRPGGWARERSGILESGCVTVRESGGVLWGSGRG